MIILLGIRLTLMTNINGITFKGQSLTPQYTTIWLGRPLNH